MCLLVELHLEGSVPVACAADLFYRPALFSYYGLVVIQSNVRVKTKHYTTYTGENAGSAVLESGLKNSNFHYSLDFM